MTLPNFSDVLQVGFPLPDLLDMNYNLAELEITEVRKGGGKGQFRQCFWPMSKSLPFSTWRALD